VESGPDIFAHNIETVPRLYPGLRRGAAYRRSLRVLKEAKRVNGSLHTKSGIMVGLGESGDEVKAALEDLLRAGCDFLNIGQYLQPTPSHAAVKEYIHPRVFAGYKDTAERMGFAHVESGPYVRSSYMASAYLERTAHN
jgi:lipoic acid synthetase